jgi:hypothetical protein
MSVDWQDYLKEVQPDVSGCPIQLTLNAIRNSAIEFANQTRVWRDDVEDVVMVQGQDVYPLVTLQPNDESVIALHRVQFTDQTFPLSTIPAIHLDNARISTTEQKPRWFNQPTPDQIEMFYTPNGSSGTLECKAILKPTKTSTFGPDFMFNDWLEPIASGAKAKLLAMKRPWGDKSMVSFHRRLFINGWIEARIRDAKSNVMSSSRVRPQPFGVYRGSRARRY